MCSPEERPRKLMKSDGRKEIQTIGMSDCRGVINHIIKYKCRTFTLPKVLLPMSQRWRKSNHRNTHGHHTLIFDAYDKFQETE